MQMHSSKIRGTVLFRKAGKVDVDQATASYAFGGLMPHCIDFCPILLLRTR